MTKSRGKGPSAPSKAKGVGVSRTASRNAGSGRIKSGGGYTLTSKRKEVPVRWGPSSTNKVSPSAADQQGQALAVPKQAQPLYTGTGVQVDSGNMRAATCPAGPGGGRE